jgi:predicted N-acyltransferase
MRPPYLFETQTSIADIPSEEWDRIAGPDNPFVSHAFLLALEQSGCVGERSGWHPYHLLCRDETGDLVGAAPCYLKTHSQGEYVFDQGWAQAYERAGGSYYPKLQVSIPFTPAQGPRLLALNHNQDIKKALANGLRAVCEQTNCSSVHVTFTEAEDHAVLCQDQWLERHDEQFHWFNEGYQTYDDFLQSLQSRKRKAIRKEREQAQKSGLEIRALTGDDITESLWDAFYLFYMETGSRKWGRPYLNRAFYSLIGETMRKRILLVMAFRDQMPSAGAINFIGSDTLYGRNWGAIEHHPFLHFEVCYHQAIDYAIVHGLKKVEAGAQGQHKLARGYQPVTTKSAHYIVDPDLRRAVADYLNQERRHIALVHDELAHHTPFRKMTIETLKLDELED